MSSEDLYARLFELLDHIDEGETVVTSVRQPVALKEATQVAVSLGMDATANDATVHSLQFRLETFAQHLALERHFDSHPQCQPSLGELTIAAARLNADALADDEPFLLIAATQLGRIRPNATGDDVLLYATGLRAQLESA